MKRSRNIKDQNRTIWRQLAANDPIKKSAMMKEPHSLSFLLLFAFIFWQVLMCRSPGKQSATLYPAEPTNTTTQPSSTGLPTIFVSQTPEKMETSTPQIIIVTDFPTPRDPFSSDVVHNGPFTFDIRFFRDARFRNNPIAPSLFSDMEENGIYFMWEYQGPGLAPPVTINWGIDPDIVELLQQSEYQTHGIKNGDSKG